MASPPTVDSDIILPVKTFQGHRSWATSVAFSPNDEWVVRDSLLRIWILKDRSQIGGPLQGHSGSVRKMAVSKDGRYIEGGGEDNKVIAWDAST
ncbi:hypothetical protein HYDPIDRAFT_115024 [Hydnomerulius pinastri MD-312]|uniref:Unplaced genomic scaffold scaffold_23, whole genome shotgun sequence n=1 Tax=Hydnomerulius pinastri MD-312 TaxID=994086 RepID=A0A0C9WCI3_9AGAM|nr:hypothetical protein HYDPIDRAFT_115024 [Hydnomerulius pinastri MD-312]